MSQSPNFEPEDDDTFFELAEDGGVAIDAHVVSTELDDEDEPLVDVTIPAIFDLASESVGIYDLQVEAKTPSMLVKSAAFASSVAYLASAEREGELQVQFPNLAAGEDGYGKTFQVENKWANEGPNMLRVFLKGIS